MVHGAKFQVYQCFSFAHAQNLLLLEFSYSAGRQRTVSNMPEPVSISLTQSDRNPKVEGRATDLAAVRMPESSASLAENTSQNGGTPPRDSTWLQVEACRDFRRNICPRGDQCRFAHPESNIIGKDGKVTCCYDFLKGRCHRDYCKYYHPPNHIKERLVSAGKQFGAMMSRAPLYSAVPQFIPGDASNPIGPIVAPCGPNGYPEKLSICPDFVLGQCSLPTCLLVHPGPYVHHNVDQTVSVCRNFMKGLCLRGDKCRYYHFPLHYVFQQPFMATLPSNQGFPIDQPAMVPVYYPTPPPTPVPVIPVGMQPPFPALAQAPISVANGTLLPTVPVMPMLSPVSSPSHFIPAQPVMVGTAPPVSIIDSTAEENNFTNVSSVQQI